MRLEHAASLKGLLKPLKVRGLGGLGQPVLRHARRVDRPGAATSAATGRWASLPSAARGTGPADHWRRNDVPALAQERPLGHGRGPVAELMASTSTPVNLLADLHAIELQRITLNMQISLLHTLGRQAQECASKAAEAEDAYLRRLASIPLEHARSVIASGTPARARRRRGTGISTTMEIAP